MDDIILLNNEGDIFTKPLVKILTNMGYTIIEEREIAAVKEELNMGSMDIIIYNIGTNMGDEKMLEEFRKKILENSDNTIIPILILSHGKETNPLQIIEKSLIDKLCAHIHTDNIYRIVNFIILLVRERIKNICTRLNGDETEEYYQLRKYISNDFKTMKAQNISDFEITFKKAHDIKFVRYLELLALLKNNITDAKTFASRRAYLQKYFT